MATASLQRPPPPKLVQFLLLVLLSFILVRPRVHARSTSADPTDAAAMRDIARSLGSSVTTLGWDPSADPCSWSHVSCSSDGHVIGIQIGQQRLSGTLSPSISKLSQLQRLELMSNSLSGPLPSLSSMSSLQNLLLHDNNFTSIPEDFFSGLTSLQTVSIDNNPFSSWTIPNSMQNCTSLVNFTATNTNLTGAIPDFFGTAFPALFRLSLSYNYLEGPLPDSFRSSSLRILVLNGQKSAGKLSGEVTFIGGMSMLQQLWIHMNAFSGPLPDLSNMTLMQDFEVRDNQLTGPVPDSLTKLPSLKTVTLTNNLFQGPVPFFRKSVTVDLKLSTEQFCLPQPGPCDPRVDVLLNIAGGFGYPIAFANSWKGNDPCSGWLGITCDAGSSDITVINFKNMGLTGTISPAFANLTALRQIVLASNNISGIIPTELTSLAKLTLLDVSNNSLWGKVPEFGSAVKVDVSINPRIGQDGPDPERAPVQSRHDSTAPVNGGIIALCAILGVVIISCIVVFCRRSTKKNGRNFMFFASSKKLHPQRLDSDVAGKAKTPKKAGKCGNDDKVHVFEGGHKMPLELLRKATDNFSEENVLGRGGFGTVYLGIIENGTRLAVKRMETGLMGSKGVNEFNSEIDVLTKVRHRHLVSLLGYCWEGNERLLVYEYMPQGTLSHHLFDWQKSGEQPLRWNKRLSIALDVARGVEYLHSMAHQSFIHRDLKPSNILLDDNMKAKVADFGLVRLAPGGKNVSVETRLAGTFGYLAPEYAVTGRLTTKADVYSFGVILMELISGRKSLDETQSEENVHLATWFRRMYVNKSLHEAIDKNLEQDEDTLKSITTVAELACHCSAREPNQRPDMGHAVAVLSSLSEQWKPAANTDATDDDFAIDLNNMTLPEVLQQWEAYDSSDQLDSTITTSAPASSAHTRASTMTDGGSPPSVNSTLFPPKGR